MIFEDYVARGMSLGDLQAKLNADLERFPPPDSPDPRRRTGRWGRSSVWEILRNPKYTGYQVWNRRARKRGGKTNPPRAVDLVRGARPRGPGFQGDVRGGRPPLRLA
jgi:site-specific DNA recombinase